MNNGFGEEKPRHLIVSCKGGGRSNTTTHKKYQYPGEKWTTVMYYFLFEIHLQLTNMLMLW